MSKAQPMKKNQESPEAVMKESNNSNSVPFKFNVQAPEFVPRTQTQIPVSGYFYPYFQFLGANGSGSDWFYVGDQESPYLISNPNVARPNYSMNFLTDDLRQKIVKQVEYQFNDLSLLANDSLVKHISKDPEGYVPLSVIASTKKIKSLVSNHNLIAQALRSSSKLVVSSDGKKVKRKHPFTDKEKEELQSRTVVAENLPEDHSHQNLDKIFGVVGSVKTIRVCHPQESNSSRSKGEYLISNKLHALVEYETTDIAEKAVEKLSDERNWRKGLRVRLLLRCSPKSVLKIRNKTEFEGILEEEEGLSPEYVEESSQKNNIECLTESHAEDNLAGSRKGWARGRGMARGRAQSHIGRGLLTPYPQCSSPLQCEALARQNSKGPRMPDGTRGFTMARGKPLSTPSIVTSAVE